MMHRLLIRAHQALHNTRYVASEEVIALFLVLFVFIAPVAASTRFEDRSLYMNSSLPGVTTSYTVSLRYMSPPVVGSLDMLFCIDPIPHHPCVTPPGLNVSAAVLSAQAGETGFTIQSRTANRLVLTRTPVVPASPDISSYKFDNIVNPTDTNQAFSIRLKSHSSTNATGPQIDFGSVRGQATEGIVLETQVPPMLIFCLAGEVQENCTDTNQNYYSNMGQLSPTSTLTAQSQMAVGTNASGGFAIMAHGDPMSAGTNVIAPLKTPTASRQGVNQFGINLVANNLPAVGNNPEGSWANAQPTSGYSTPNRYKYVSGDVVASSPNVSLMKKFTVSYIVNSSKDLRPGVYTTTINYIASGRF